MQLPAAAPDSYGDRVDDVARGLRTAAVLLAVAAAVALAAAGVWLAVQGGGFRTKLALSLVVVAALLGLTGGTTFTRAADNDARAFLGWGPDREEPGGGSGLTALGVFLFVSLPLFVGGLVLFGSG
jgi:hypothetical protein